MDSTPAASSACPKAHDRMLSQFAEAIRQFLAIVEQNRKIQIMSRKSARQSLEFDSPKRKRPALFSPQQRAQELIADSQEQVYSDCKKDSLHSHR